MEGESFNVNFLSGAEGKHRIGGHPGVIDRGPESRALQAVRFPHQTAKPVTTDRVVDLAGNGKSCAQRGVIGLFKQKHALHHRAGQASPT